MKKSSKPILFFVLTLLIISAVVFLLRVSLKIKYEQLVVKKIKLENDFKTNSNLKDKLKANYESLIAEERIVAVAKSELGLIRNIEPAFIVKYDNNKIKEINEILNEKYE
jgi:hypothetical protein